MFFYYSSEEIIHIINDIIDVIRGTIKKTMKIILSVQEHHFVCTVFESQFILLFQNDIHKFSQQYGHCEELISNALLHFGQSL